MSHFNRALQTADKHYNLNLSICPVRAEKEQILAACSAVLSVITEIIIIIIIIIIIHLPKVTVKWVALLRRIRAILASEFGPKPAKLTDVSSSMPMSVQ